MSTKPSPRLAGLLLGLLLLSGTAAAQEMTGCRSVEAVDPPRQIVTCGSGLTIEAEAAVDLKLFSTSKSGRPRRLELDGNAVLMKLEPGSGPFQISTPQAIASVRGTIYAVDVTPTTTSVYVQRGKVAVSRRVGSSQVLLGPGQGVDVRAGGLLVVKRWPTERVSRLLARFGR